MAPNCVSRSIELEAAATKPPKSEPFDIVNDEKQKEKQVADQFFRSLLGDKAENADKKAENALTDSGTANTVASDALGKSKVADDTSEHALALARSTEKYAAWRTISDKQADIIVKHLAPLEGHTVEMFDFTTDPETAGYAQRLGTVLSKVMHAHLSEYPGKFIPPPGLSITVGKDREKDFALIVEALDVAGIEKASALRRAAEHRAPDDGIEINVGGKH